MDFLRDLAFLALAVGAILLFIDILQPRKKRGVGCITKQVVTRFVSATVPRTPAAKVLQPGDEILDLQVGDDTTRITFQRGHGTAIVDLPRVDLPANAFALARKKA